MTDPTSQTSAGEVELLPVKPADEALADAIAGAIARYAVAYSHDTTNELRTVNRSWKVHETGYGNPFDRGIWLGEFDNKEAANALASALRKEAAHQIAAQALLTADREGWTRCQEAAKAAAASSRLRYTRADIPGSNAMRSSIVEDIAALPYTPPSHAGGGSLQKAQTSAGDEARASGRDAGGEG